MALPTGESKGPFPPPAQTGTTEGAGERCRVCPSVWYALGGSWWRLGRRRVVSVVAAPSPVALEAAAADALHLGHEAPSTQEDASAPCSVPADRGVAVPREATLRTPGPVALGGRTLISDPAGCSVVIRGATRTGVAPGPASGPIATGVVLVGDS